jgi:hypothetical protein
MVNRNVQSLLATICLALIATPGWACIDAPQKGMYEFDREAMVVEIGDDARAALRRGDRRTWAGLQGMPEFADVPRPWLKRAEWDALPGAERDAFLEKAASALAQSPEMQKRLDAIRIRLELKPDCSYAISGGNAPGLERATEGKWLAQGAEVVLLQVQMGGVEGTSDYRARLDGDRIKFRSGPQDRRGMLPLRKAQ